MIVKEGDEEEIGSLLEHTTSQGTRVRGAGHYGRIESLNCVYPGGKGAEGMEVRMGGKAESGQGSTLLTRESGLGPWEPCCPESQLDTDLARTIKPEDFISILTSSHQTTGDCHPNLVAEWK